MMNSHRLTLPQILLGVILLAYVVYGSVFIYQSSFDVDGTRYFALFDDAMISMTYARNLARGEGLVWYPGLKVEGYSNPLWVGYMSLWHLLPIPESKVSLALQITGLVCMLGLLVLVYKIAKQLSKGNELASLLATGMVGFYYPLSNWSLLGNEVSILLLITAACVWLAMKTQSDGKFRWQMYALLAISLLIRLDAAVIFAVISGWLVLTDKANRWRHLVVGVGLGVLMLGGQTLFRWLYYGDIMPATYYLKMTGLPTLLRLQRGLYVTGLFFAELKWYLMPIPLLFLFWRRDKQVALGYLLFMAMVLYSIYVGGDAWEHRGGANRFISLAMPFYLMLQALAIVHVADWIANGLARIANRKLAWLMGLARVGAAIVCLAGLTIINLAKGSGTYADLIGNTKESPLGYALLLKPSVYKPGTERYTRDALLLRQVTSPDAKIAVIAAGNIAYFSDRPTVDMLGKSDMVIAKEPSRVGTDVSLMDLRPGHIKWDYAWSIGQLQPDVVVELRVSTVEQGELYLDNYDRVAVNNHTMYFKQGSTNINWEALEDVRD